MENSKQWGMTPEWIGEKSNSRLIGIRVSDACNFDCRYCNEHNTIRKKYMTFEEYVLIIEKLKLLYSIENKKQKLLLWGGEPLLNRDLKRIMEYTSVQPFIQGFRIHSNFSIRNDEVLDFLLENNIECYSSIHLDYFLNPKIKENFVYNLDKISNKGNLTEINLMFQDLKEFEKCKEIKNEFKNYPINIAPVTQLLNSHNKQVKFLLSTTGEYLLKEINTSKGYQNYIDIFDIDHRGFQCHTSMHNIIINTNGDVFLCQTSFFSNYTHGNIYNYTAKDFEKFFKPFECIHKTCVCGHYIYKEREKFKEIESEYTYSIFTPDYKIRPKKDLNNK